ncbi:hypothetical protein WP1_272 [Pseudomonas phage WP1]
MPTGLVQIPNARIVNAIGLPCPVGREPGNWRYHRPAHAVRRRNEPYQ